MFEWKSFHFTRHSAFFICNGRRNPFVGESLEVFFAHLTFPTMADKVCSELLVLFREIFAAEVGDKDPGHKHANDTW